MKRYPEHRIDYYDDSLSFYLDDRATLLDGQASLKAKPPSVAGGLTGASEAVNVLPSVIANGSDSFANQFLLGILTFTI